MAKLEDQTISIEVKEGPALQALQTVAMWHKIRSEQLTKLLENNKAGVTLALLTNDPAAPANEVVLDEQMSRGFGIAMMLALSLFGELPFQLQQGPAVVDAEFEEVPE